MSTKLRQLGRFLAHVFRRFDQDRCLQIASSLTYTTLLALVPLVTIMLTLMSAFPVFSGLGQHIHAFLLANMLPDKAGTIVSGYIEQFSGRAGRLTAFGTAFLAVTAFMMMFTMERAFNSIWRVSRPRPVAQRILVYWAALTLGPVLIGASLSITSYLVGASLGVTRATPLAGMAILWLVPFVLTWAAFTLLYFIVPNRAVKPRHAVIGGLVAAFVFEMMKRSFAVFIAQMPTYTLVYGAFAVIPIFLLWIYFSWVVVVIGALITALAPDFAILGDRPRDAGSAGFGEALATLLALARAQRNPEVLDLRRIARATSLTVDQAERLLERMTARGWVARSGAEKYALVFDKDRLLVGDVYREFVLDGRRVLGDARNEALEQLMTKLTANADDSLNVPIGHLLEGEAA